jgi:oligosaccharide repeat unit polymerase
LILLSIVLLSLAAVVNYRVGGKTPLFPPLVYCAVWAFGLLLLLCSGRYFYPLRPQTIFIFVCGAFAFSLGSWAAAFLPERIHPPQPIVPEASNRILNFLIAIVVIGAPFFYRWLTGLVADQTVTGSFLFLARSATEEVLRKGWAVSIFGTLTELSRIVAMMAFYDRDGHPKRAIFTVVLAFVMSAMWGQKYGPLTLAVALFCIDTMQTKRLRWKTFLSVAGVAFVISFALLYYLQRDPGDAIPSVLRLIVLYAVGGLVGFDRILRNPSLVPQELNPIHIYYLRIVQKLGGHVVIPETAGFISVGPNSLIDNVFTVYWSYMDLGLIGVFGFTAAAGFLITLVYKRAIHGRRGAVMIYCVLLFGILFSMFNEVLFSVLYLMLKVWVFSWLVYAFPQRWQQLTAMLRTRVETGATHAVR